MSADIKNVIEAAYDDAANIGQQTQGAVREAVEEAFALLDSGQARVAEKVGRDWQVNMWLKKAVLLYFKLNDMQLMEASGLGVPNYWDKIPLKTANWTADDYRSAGFRAVPGAIVRRSAFIGKGAVLMPSFVNLGAYVGAGTMIDTWATVGSCAQIGANVHISGGTGIGGVLEPLQAGPVIIEDDCFIGARSEVAEGVIVREGAVISMGVFLGQSTKIIDRTTGEVSYGEVPAGAVVVPGTIPGKPLADGGTGPALAAAVIVKYVDAKTRAKIGINEILRD